MALPKTLGLPRMHKEAGEKRVFLPNFVQWLASLGVNIYIEEGYGSRSGYSFNDYHRANPLVHLASAQEAYRQDVVLVLRSPRPDEFKLMKRDGILFSMLHFPTRPLRIQRLQERARPITRELLGRRLPSNRSEARSIFDDFQQRRSHGMGFRAGRQ